MAMSALDPMKGKNRSPQFRIFYRQIFPTGAGSFQGTGGLSVAWY